MCEQASDEQFSASLRCLAEAWHQSDAWVTIIEEHKQIALCELPEELEVERMMGHMSTQSPIAIVPPSLLSGERFSSNVEHAWNDVLRASEVVYVQRASGILNRRASMISENDALILKGAYERGLLANYATFAAETTMFKAWRTMLIYIFGYGTRLDELFDNENGYSIIYDKISFGRYDIFELNDIARKNKTDVILRPGKMSSLSSRKVLLYSLNDDDLNEKLRQAYECMRYACVWTEIVRSKKENDWEHSRQLEAELLLLDSEHQLSFILDMISDWIENNGIDIMVRTVIDKNVPLADVLC